VSEETEAAENGSAAGLAGADSAALALALGGASRARADAFLDNQNALIVDQRRMLHLQMEEFEEEKPLKLTHLRIRRFGDYAKMAFEFSIGLLMLALVGGVGVMVWNAAHADGLIIESFSVPPDMAGKGVTGDVAASQLLDKLTAIQTQSTSVRPTKSYANSWGDDVKVEIPDIGVSVSEAYRFLRGWLGHETHVSGEITRTATGIAVTTRIGGDGGATLTGAETDLDTLMQGNAEHVFRVIQADRYARYLIFPRPGAPPRYEEARAVLNQLLAEGSPAEKSWAWGGLGNLANIQGDYRGAAAAARKAIAADPDNILFYNNLASVEVALSHSEGALSAARSSVRLLEQGPRPEIIPAYVDRIEIQNRFLAAFLIGDHLAAAGLAQRGTDLPMPRNTPNVQFFEDNIGIVRSLLHDGAGVRAWWNNAAPPETPQNAVRQAIARSQAAAGLQDWRSVTASAVQIEAQVSAPGAAANFARLLMQTQLRPLLALAKARLGDVAGAETLIATTPADCYDCLRMRGTIAGLANRPGRADYWFARVVHDAPSIPFAYADWGRILLERGQPDAAIAKFTIANQKGPHFADPLEMWGEALIARNQSHLALAKFAEAEKYAPNWGRLHLKWGEALVYAGKADESKKQFARATQLDLTAAERSELSRQGVRHA
jgi:tetratricopeptide (TPR) repeat protein